MAARATHLSLIALALLVPLSGWAVVSVSTLAIPSFYFNLIIIPHLPLPKSGTSEAFWALAHAMLAYVTLGLVAIHAAAAFYHHLVRRDLVLIRMLRSGSMPRTGSTVKTSGKDDTLSRGNEYDQLRQAVHGSDPAAFAPRPCPRRDAGCGAKAPALADAAGTYRIASSSRIQFSVGQVGGSGGIAGSFTKFSGIFRIDGDDVGRSSVEFTLFPESVRSTERRIEDFLRSSAVFDAANHRTVTFRSTGVSQTGPDAATIEGVLTARGKSRKERFDVRLTDWNSARFPSRSAAASAARPTA